ncbi:MAG: hypothetical protein NC252_05820 [Roseburia sp.]|nr:hypothetical protein [Roseburia sp.]MCM1420478.1 hypothetical protein [Bacteroides sp.]
MASPKDPQHFAEMEYCITRYFNCHILPVMRSERAALQEAQAKEIADYSRSFSGIMRSVANAIHNEPDDTLLFLRATGKECSKTAEDYVAACKDNISGNKEIQADMQRIACDWRTAVIKEIGRERYDALSARLGADLALAYLDHRLEELMIDRMVADEMPKSSFEYIMRKGVTGSLFGMAYEVNKSPLQAEIEERGEAAYNPTKTERAAAKGVSIASDTVAMGGVYSWASLARVAGTEIVFSGLESALGKEKSKGMTVDEVISQAVFGGSGNRFDAFRKQSRSIKEYENTYLQTINTGLSKKMSLLKEKPFWELDLSESTSLHMPFKPFITSPPETKERDASIPMVIAPGKEQAFLADQEELKRKQAAITSPPPEAALSQEETNDNVPQNAQPSQSDDNSDGNQAGWSGLLRSFGLDGISDVGRNLPYVIAMLPDMLVGLLTGKTQSVGLKKDMIPVASILMGLFVRNPLLKMVLIGMGGANLFNKVGHEAIERETGTRMTAMKYRQYAEEELNPRIASPILKGNILVATIDGVPCSVTLPDNAADACLIGALPLNTLANAVLARHDRMSGISPENHRNIDMDTTVNRDRGMTLR